MNRRLLATCLVPMAVLALMVGSEELPAKEKQRPESYPSFFKVFSKDGNQSLTAVCEPKDRTQPKNLSVETTCRFTDVRFEVPSPTQNTFSPLLEDMAKINPEIAEQLRKEPEKTRAEWKTALAQMQADLCAEKALREAKDKMKEMNNDSKRKRMMAEVVKGCTDNIAVETFLTNVSELANSTCQVFVDHFSLEFRKIDDRKWLYTQAQPSLVGTLKVYELTAEPEHSLWTLRETRLMVGQQETAAQPEQKIWSSRNWDSYELPEQCHFLSHQKVQYQF
jgi:hypothetical protein